MTPREQFERRIAKDLGVTYVGLQLLCRYVAGKSGGRTKGTAGVKLVEQGLLTDRYESLEWKHTLTDKGRDVVRRARQMGF